MEIYDDIAESYKEHELTSLKRKVTIEYSFLEYLGDVRNKDVLDMACGEGYYTRIIKQCGAKKIIGIDVSNKMIEFAKREEKKRPLGIDYYRYDIARLPVIGEFDTVTAVFLLHYSRTKDELFSMCRNIANNLKKGGRFITLNLDPGNPLQPFEKYESTMTCDGPLKEGCAINITLYVNDKPACRFNNYHWKKSTYEEALKGSGFEDIRWHSIMISEDGIARFGSRFWESYLKQPGVAVLECRKT